MFLFVPYANMSEKKNGIVLFLLALILNSMVSNCSATVPFTTVVSNTEIIDFLIFSYSLDAYLIASGRFNTESLVNIDARGELLMCCKNCVLYWNTSERSLLLFTPDTSPLNCGWLSTPVL